MLWQVEDGEAFRNGVLQPFGESWRSVAVADDEFVERGLRFWKRIGVPDAAQLGPDAPSDGGTWCVMDRVAAK